MCRVIQQGNNCCGIGYCFSLRTTLQPISVSVGTLTRLDIWRKGRAEALFSVNMTLTFLIHSSMTVCWWIFRFARDCSLGIGVTGM